MDTVTFDSKGSHFRVAAGSVAECDTAILAAKGANFLGFEVLGADGRARSRTKIIRGCGDIVLTRNQLLFRQWLPAREVAIAVQQIRDTRLGYAHNGKFQFPFRVLRVFYRQENETWIAGFRFGGRFSLTGGWQDEAIRWQSALATLIGSR